MNQHISIKLIQSKILMLRDEKVILDRDLALLYGVETRILKQQVRRNLTRFPNDFMFKLTEKDIEKLVSQKVIPNKSMLGGAKPMAFTEQGVAMLSSVLRSNRAVQVNIAIMRTFVRMRELMATHKGLKEKIDEMGKKYDKNFQVVYSAIKELMVPRVKKGKRKEKER